MDRKHEEWATEDNVNEQNGLVEISRLELDSETKEKQTLRKKYTSCRWVVAYNACLVTTMVNATRMNLSMAVVCMAADGNYTTLSNSTHNNGSTDTTYPNQNITLQRVDTKVKEDEWTVNWSSEMEGWILSAYGIGFAMTPLVGGYMGGKFSPKLMVTVSLMLTCITTLLFPVTVLLDIYLVIAVRFITGMCSGIIIPNIVELWSTWAPKSEKTQLLTSSIAGLTISGIITFPISGFLCIIEVQRGWPFIFYVFGGLTFLCCVLWMYCVYDTPNCHPRISEEEKLFISTDRSTKKRKMPSPPWCSILSSTAFWGLLAAHICHSSVYMIIGQMLPLYMTDVLHFIPQENGIISSVPFVGRFLGTIGFGYMADVVQMKHILTTTWTRKWCQVIGTIFAMPFLLGMTYLSDDHRTLAVTLLTIYWTLQSATNSSFRVNHLDIAPRFAGFLHGLTLTVANMISMTAPLLTSIFTDEGTREQWQNVYFICVGLIVLGSIIYVVLGSGEEQEWAKDKNKEIETNITIELKDANNTNEM